ncbi:uncharacterized protein ACRADG_005156 [Cochliomyia hominivorax]
MSLKNSSIQTIILLILLKNQYISCLPITPEEEEEHLNNRLQHYLKRLELIAQKPDTKFSSELQNLMDKFKHSIAKETFKEKSQLLEEFTNNMDLAEYLTNEFDKQYINEDILIESWYLNEIAPDVDKSLYDELVQIVRDLKEAYRIQDLEKKFNIYADIGENLSEQFLDYFYGENPSVPLLNAQLKYYQEYLNYLLKECNLESDMAENTRELLGKVEKALENADKVVKEKVIELFDDLTTKFGRYLDEHFVDFKMFKFGE